MRAWIRRNAFPVGMVLSLVALQAAVAFALSAGGGPGRVWNGATWKNTSDFAIYLGYVEQIRDGAIGLRNLYAPFRQLPFWHPFYVVVGLFSRVTGLSGIASVWAFQFASTTASVFLLHAVSRKTAKNERDASMATLLISLAGGLGWVVMLVWTKNIPTWLNAQSPDMGTEAFFFPTLFMGPHISLSLGLLPFLLRSMWGGAVSPTTRRERSAGWMAALALALVHPYVLPIIGIFLVGSAIRNASSSPIGFVRSHTGYAAALILGAIPHAWGLVANQESRSLLTENILPLRPVWFWAVVLLPWIALVISRFARRVPVRRDEEWIAVWLVSSLVAIALPFAWDQKLVVSWHAALVWLALPSIVSLRRSACGTGVTALAVVCVLSISSLFVLVRQVPFLNQRLADSMPMYVRSSDVEAWAWVKENMPADARVLPTDPFSGTWGAAYMVRPVWIGHAIDTPDYEKKISALSSVPTLSRSNLLDFLDREDIDVILTGDSGRTHWYAETLAGTSWRVGAQFDESGVIIRRSSEITTP